MLLQESINHRKNTKLTLLAVNFQIATLSYLFTQKVFIDNFEITTFTGDPGKMHSWLSSINPDLILFEEAYYQQHILPNTHEWFSNNQRTFLVCLHQKGNYKIIKKTESLKTSAILHTLLSSNTKSTTYENPTNKKSLTEKETQMLQMLAQGRSQKMIAFELNVSINTVKTLIKRSYQKLGVHSVTEALSKTFDLHHFIQLHA
jgi:DNA-binding CsgD family transcriptional regulator